MKAGKWDQTWNGRSSRLENISYNKYFEATKTIEEKVCGV